MRALLVAVLFAAVARSGMAGKDLFNGQDLAGWTFVTLKHVPLEQAARVTPEGTLAVVGKPTGYLVAPGGSYSDYRLHVEYRWTAPKGNSGIFIDIASGPRRGKPWPLCLQIQNRDHHTGELIPMAGYTFDGAPPDGKPCPLRQPPRENPIGAWNSCDIAQRGNTVEVTVNGLVQNRATGCSPNSGRIGLQLEGYPFEIRSVRLIPLGP